MLLRYCVPSMNPILSKTVARTTGSSVFSPAIFISLLSQVTIFICRIKFLFTIFKNRDV